MKPSRMGHPLVVKGGLVAIPEGWGVDVEGAEVDVALAAVVDFVIDGVLNGHDTGLLPLVEDFVEGEELGWRDFGEFFVEERGVFVPEAKEVGLCGGFGVSDAGPIAGGDAVDDGNGHADHLEGHVAEGAHAADGEGEELVLGEGFDGASGEAAMLLPVVEEGFGGDEGDGGGFGRQVGSPCTGGLNFCIDFRSNCRQDMS